MAEAPSPAPFEDALVPRQLAERFTGDLERLRERGVVRALVSPSRTDFFVDSGRPVGLMVEVFERFEAFLNRDVGPGQRRIKVMPVPVAFEDLIPALREGRGDVAAGFLTLTPERERAVAFASGSSLPVDEVVVTSRGGPVLDSLDDLSGRRVLVMRGTSYATHLRELGEAQRARGLAPVEVVEADSRLVTEDILEMVNAGVVELTVADDFRAQLWAEVLPDLVVRDDLVVHDDGRVGWAVRRQNPELLAETAVFLRGLRKGTLVGNVLFRRYYQNTRWIESPISERERLKLDTYSDLFRRYADRYQLDWRAVAALAYQESGLDHGRRSRAGAVGLMQVLPRTAADPRIGIDDVSDLESNVHAAVKYLDLLRSRYFADEDLSEDARMAFVWAAYNAGPSRVRQMRERAQQMGFDRNRWFRHVEHAALEMVGREPVRYVSNVFKYYVAYQLWDELRPADGS